MRDEATALRGPALHHLDLFFAVVPVQLPSDFLYEPDGH